MILSKKSVVFCLILVLLTVGTALADTTDAQIAALETRVEALESRLFALEAEMTRLLSNGPKPMVDDPKAFTIGHPLTLARGLTITIDQFTTGADFQYFPADGISSTTLRAKEGLTLLMLRVTIDNSTDNDFFASAFLDAYMRCGEGYQNKARNILFYLSENDVFAGGLKNVSAGQTLEGLLLFAIPAPVETNRDRIWLELFFDGNAYECTLREGE